MQDHSSHPPPRYSVAEAQRLLDEAKSAEKAQRKTAGQAIYEANMRKGEANKATRAIARAEWRKVEQANERIRLAKQAWGEGKAIWCFGHPGEIERINALDAELVAAKGAASLALAEYKAWKAAKDAE